MTTEDLSPRELVVQGQAVRRLRIVPLDYRHPRLAADLADALRTLQATTDMTVGTTYNYKRAFASLMFSLPNSLPVRTNLATGGHDLIDALFAWEESLLRTYGPRSDRPNTLGGMVRRLFSSHIAAGRDASLEVVTWASGPPLHAPGIETPLDEFSNAERLKIRDECRDRIRAMEQRLDRGRRLLEAGRDPRIHGWENPANVLWVVVHLGRPTQDSIEQELRSAGVSIAETDVPRQGQRRAVSAMLSHLYPTRHDLMAFRTLLQLQTGAAPEEWTGVTLEDLSFCEDGVRVRLCKARAHRFRSTHCPITAGAPGEGWKSGDLIHRLLRVTQLARDELSEPTTSHLFCTVMLDKNRRMAARAVPFDRREFSELLAAIDPPISMPHDARRLRKTVKSVRAGLLRSADLAADDHTVAVFHRHYAQSTTIHVLAGQAVATAQTHVVDKLREGPTFINASASQLIGSEDAIVASAAQEEVAASDVDRAMGPATCIDPLGSPFAEPGRLCKHRPTMCFACPNAIVFIDHLPRILAYREILEDRRRELAPQHFAASYGQQLTNLDSVLGQFTADQLDVARAELSNHHRRIHVPLAERGTHL